LSEKIETCEEESHSGVCTKPAELVLDHTKTCEDDRHYAVEQSLQNLWIVPCEQPLYMSHLGRHYGHQVTEPVIL